MPFAEMVPQNVQKAVLQEIEAVLEREAEPA